MTGSHTLSAQYSGDVNYAAGTSPPTSFVVVKATPTLTGYGVGGPVVAGVTATATAAVLGSQGGVAPTGTVTFYNNNVVIPGTVSYTSTTSPPFLNASMPTIFATPGTYPITASYSGDANYNPVTSPGTQSLIVLGPISVVRGAGIVVSSPGLGGTTPITVNANGGFSGAVTVSCTPDPTALETTCSLTSGSNSGSSVQINVSGAGASLTFMVTTTAPHQLARRGAAPFGVPPGIALAGLLVVFVPAVRRHRTALLCLLGVCVTLGLGACGGSNSTGGGGSGKIDPGTGLAQYSYTVTATTGTGVSLYTTTTQVPVLVN